MKIVLFTPVVRTSAIGRVARLVTAELMAAGHKVTIVRSDSARLARQPVHDFGTEIVAWQNEGAVRSVTNNADYVAYHVGNSFEMHEGCVHWLPKLPGVVCLHDFFIGSLFYEWSHANGGANRKQALSILRVWYGKEIADQYFRFRSGDDFIARTSIVAPMTEWICSMATGVLAHSSWGIQRVLNASGGPVQTVPLAYDAPYAKSTQPQRTNSSGTLRILTFGHINPNKRAASVITAIGESSLLREKTEYVLAGSIASDMRDQLQALADQMAVKLKILGQVDDATLASEIVNSDIISCLRWPSLESASASLIESLLYGKATIVTDTGFYSELPADYVIKISPTREIPALRKALERLSADEAERLRIGQAARAWAIQTFSVNNYVEQTIELFRLVSRARPGLRGIRHYSQTLNKWQATEQVLSIASTTSPMSIFEGDG